VESVDARELADALVELADVSRTLLVKQSSANASSTT